MHPTDRKDAKTEPHFVFVVSPKHQAVRTFTCGPGSDSKWLEWDQRRGAPRLTLDAHDEGMFLLSDAYAKISDEEIAEDPALAQVKDRGFEVYRSYWEACRAMRHKRVPGTSEREMGKDNERQGKPRSYPEPFDAGWFPPRVRAVIGGTAPEQALHEVPPAPSAPKKKRATA